MRLILRLLSPEALAVAVRSDGFEKPVVADYAQQALAADPAYGPTVPYKFAAEDVVLIPINAEMVVPDLRWIVGGLLLIVYLVILWRRAVKANSPTPQRA